MAKAKKTNTRRSSVVPTVLTSSPLRSPHHSPVKRLPKIEWVKNPDWTWTLITYLTDHSTFRTKLFSDSTADAAKEGRPKTVGKDGKAQQYAVLAKAVFEDDPEQHLYFAQKPARFGLSVETRLRRLKKEYGEHLKVLGSTGAGLSPDDVTPGTPLANLVEQITLAWPWWKEFHSFWRELPNYNPIAVATSTPGLDHASEASLLFGSGDTQSGDGEEFDRDDEAEAEPDELENAEVDAGEGEAENVLTDWAPTPPPADHAPLPTVDVPTLSAHPLLKPPRAKASVDIKPKVLSGRDAGIAKANSATSKQGPKTPLERFNENRTNDTARLSRKHEMSHEFRMANAQNKRYKYEYKYAAPQRAAERAAENALKIAEIERQTRIEELKLQIELARIQQGIVSAPSSTVASTSTSATPLASSPIPDYSHTYAMDSSDDVFGSFGSPYNFNSSSS